VQKELELSHGLQQTQMFQKVSFIFDEQSHAMFHTIGIIIEEHLHPLSVLFSSVNELRDISEPDHPSNIIYVQGPDRGYFWWAFHYAREFENHATQFCQDDDLCIFEMSTQLYIPYLCGRASPQKQESCYLNYAANMNNTAVCELIYDDFELQEGFVESCLEFYNDEKVLI
jgi:hypothetical protein